MFVGKSLGQERRREAHSLAHDPHFGRREELLAESPLQRAHVQPDMHGQSFHPESLLSDNDPKVVRSEKVCPHTMITVDASQFFQ